ncbi:MAG: hypothetical protein D6785_16100 [Planctomycetota bacterium]|nr:MAG: hypothetical protein D6785_16100 [Planctomycetota bacterium]
MYTWKEIPIESSLEEKLKIHESEFIHSLADTVTRHIMESLPVLDAKEIEKIIRKIQNNPGLLGTLCFQEEWE